MESKAIFDSLNYLSNIILTLNVFLYFKSYRNKTVAFKIFAFYLLYVLTIQLRMSYLASTKTNNLVYTHYYFAGQLVFLSIFFIIEFKNKLLSKVIKSYLFIALISLAIYYYLFPEARDKHNIYEVLATSIPLVIYSFYFLIKKIDSDNKKFIYLNSGIFLYLSCSSLIFAAGSLEYSSMKIIIWYSNVILYLIYQVLVSVEWYKNFRKIAS